MHTVLKVEIILAVPSIEETAEWYERVLGWSSHYDAYDDQGRCMFGSVTNGEGALAGLNLSRAPAGAGAANRGEGFTGFILVDDVDALFGQVVESGDAYSFPPKDQPWGGRTFTMEDVNGYRLTFYSWLAEGSELGSAHE